MKKRIQLRLQKILGVQTYLYYFARFRIFFGKVYGIKDDFPKFIPLIQEGAILDIGANIGITAVPLAKKFPNAQIHAFEPVPINCAVFKRIIKHYRLTNVVLHQNALGNETGMMRIVVPEINNVRMFGLSHVEVNGRYDDWNSGEVYKVRVAKLDDEPALKQEKKIAALKIDVENYEFFVLQGGMKLLQQHKPIIYCELWDNEMLDPVTDLMRSIDYDVMVFEGKTLNCFTSQPATNYVFVHKETELKV